MFNEKEIYKKYQEICLQEPEGQSRYGRMQALREELGISKTRFYEIIRFHQAKEAERLRVLNEIKKKCPEAEKCIEQLKNEI